MALLVPDNPTMDQATAALIVVRAAFKTFCFADARTVTIDGVTVVDLSQQAGVDESSFLVSLLGAVCRAPVSGSRPARSSVPRGMAGSGAGKRQARAMHLRGVLWPPAFGCEPPEGARRNWRSAFPPRCSRVAPRCCSITSTTSRFGPLRWTAR